MKATGTGRSARRASSVPPSRCRENSRLEFLRSKKQNVSNLDVADVPPEGTVTTRGRKRESSRPMKRRKRSSSTSTVHRPQLSVQMQTRSRSRSRADSSTTEVTPRSRVSARLASKIYSFRNPDIYSHLAGLEGSRNLLNEPPSGSVNSLAPNATLRSPSSDRRPNWNGRKRKLADEDAKKDLMEEWARMRRFQGTLSLSGMVETSCSSQAPPHDARESTASVRPETISRRHTSDHEPMLERSYTDPFPARAGSENASSPSTNVDFHVPSTNLRVGEDSPNDTLVDRMIRGASQHTVPSEPTFTSLSSSALQTMPTSEPDEAVTPTRDCRSPCFDVLDSGEEFRTFDIPEIFFLPWEPVASHLYVPPGLGKLISAMREQLTAEVRARQRAEELYESELNRRISAERTIADLRNKLEEGHLSERRSATCWAG